MEPVARVDEINLRIRYFTGSHSAMAHLGGSPRSGDRSGDRSGGTPGRRRTSPDGRSDPPIVRKAIVLVRKAIVLVREAIVLVRKAIVLWPTGIPTPGASGPSG